MADFRPRPDPTTRWDDPAWREPSDNRWQHGLRLQQAWWREVVACQPAGPSSGSTDRLVASMLPLDVPVSVNLMTAEAMGALERARVELRGRPGMIQPDRLRRNLLSSQPLCFNLFGHLASHPAALLPWVREFDPDASSVDDIRLEWAPDNATIAGSAFDAFVVYGTGDGRRGFVGVECKYHENLKATLTTPAAPKFRAATEGPSWVAGAAGKLDVTGLRQLWFNQILTQITREAGGFDRGFGVVVACDADASAREATDVVSTQLTNPDELRFSSIEHIVSTVQGLDEWSRAFTQRYTDFSPVLHLLPSGDARRQRP